MIDKNLKFESNNVVFQVLEERDVKDIASMLEDEEVGQYLYFCPSPRKVYEEFFGRLAKEIKEKNHLKNVAFTLRDKNTKEFLGITGVNSIEFIKGIYEVGYQIPRKHWKKGYGRLACEFLIFYLYNYLEFHRITLDAYGKNIASLKIAENLSFTKEGLLRNYYKVEEGYDDKVIYGLLREEIDEDGEILNKFRKL